MQSELDDAIDVGLREDYYELLLRVREEAARRDMTFREAAGEALTAWLEGRIAGRTMEQAEAAAKADPPRRVVLRERKKRVWIGPERVRALREEFDGEIETVYAYSKRHAREIGCTIGAVMNVMYNRTSRDPAYVPPEIPADHKRRGRE